MPTAREMKPVIIEAVREVIREEIMPRLDKLEENVEKFSDMKDMLLEQQKAITEIKDSLDFTENQINGICNKIIPDLDKKYGDLITNLCMNILDMDTHRRKWSIIINGIQGEAGEAERLTRSKAHSFACNKLKIPGADSHSFAACHRLAQNENSGIIIKFNDLHERNSWLENAKNLKNSKENISLSPDIHPVLRQLKKDILQKRKDLPPDQKKSAQVKYLPRWPYICLKIRNGPTMNPTIPKENIVKSYLEKV